MNSKTTLELAFELARSGRHPNTTDIRRVLQAEGYDLKQLEGRALAKQLRSIIDKSAPVAQ